MDQDRTVRSSRSPAQLSVNRLNELGEQPHQFETRWLGLPRPVAADAGRPRTKLGLAGRPKVKGNTKTCQRKWASRVFYVVRRELTLFINATPKDFTMKKIIATLIAGLFATAAFAQAPAMTAAPDAKAAASTTASAPEKVVAPKATHKAKAKKAHKKVAKKAKATAAEAKPEATDAAPAK